LLIELIRQLPCVWAAKFHRGSRWDIDNHNRATWTLGRHPHVIQLELHICLSIPLPVMPFAPFIQAGRGAPMGRRWMGTLGERPNSSEGKMLVKRTLDRHCH
jgi:hypothetical protein